MRIVIDMQGAQTESRFRGIGRYTMAFAQAVVRNRGEHEILLALSSLFPDTIEPIRAAFDGLLPQENIRVWHALGPVKDENPNNQNRREIAELMREAFLASLNADIIHICSLFEGYVDDAVTSIGCFDKNTPVSVTLHDLIPLLSPDQYLVPNPNFATYYYRKLDSLKRAALYLAISNSSKKEIIDCLSVNESIIVNTYEGVESYFRILDREKIDKDTISKKFSISRPFVLYTGGADERKNLPRLIEAWSALPVSLRQSHQLVFAGRMPEGNIAEFQRIASKYGLKKDELLFSGYVSDEELVQLYNLCKLFVFPSWHEGFGLPALEAMACGAAVIGANTTSLPEVIGFADALFDPFDVTAIRNKLQKALTDEDFLIALRTHAVDQAKRFSWDATAQSAIAAWEQLHKTLSVQDSAPSQAGAQPRDLIQAVVDQLGAAPEHVFATIATHMAQNERSGTERQLLLDISELCQRDSATGVQRVVRSYLHHLLRNPPRGFRVQAVYATQTDGYRYARTYTGRIFGQIPSSADDPPIRWQRGDIFFGLDMQHHVQLAHADTFALMRREGVVVKFLVHDLLPIQLADFFKDSNAKELHTQWLTMIASFDEAICVSKSTAEAYEEWISASAIQTAPNFRTSWVHNGADIEGSRPSRGVPPDALDTLHLLQSRPTFLTVSTLEPRKAQTQILDAIELLWERGEDVNLVLVGQQGWKIEALIERIIKHPEIGKRLFWLKGISDEYLESIYKVSTCLVAASINEGFGLPLIEAARHGIPIIARDIPVFREVAGQAAFYFKGETGSQLADALDEWLQLRRVGNTPNSAGVRWLTWKQSTEQLKYALISKNYPKNQLLVDISELVQRDAKSGIQRVVRSILKEWLENPPDGFRVEPIYALPNEDYRYAKKFTTQFMKWNAPASDDPQVEVSPGDLFFGLDMQPQVQISHRKFYKTIRNYGVKVKFLLHDLLPIKMPEYFPDGNKEGFIEWLYSITDSDGVICVSRATANELSEWVNKNLPHEKRDRLQIAWSHNGADIDNSVSTFGIPDNADYVLGNLSRRISFLMVGTLEPRKGHSQVLDAFNYLWSSGKDINLVLVGKKGWKIDDLVNRISNHDEFNKRLFWLSGVSDEYLEKIYQNSNCLIAASYGEGFGLPIIEAAQKNIAVIARDIPVFREVAQHHALYFNSEVNNLSEVIEMWLKDFEGNGRLNSTKIPYITWRESARNLLLNIL